MVPSCSPGLELSFDIYNAFWMKYAETLFMRNTPVLRLQKKDYLPYFLILNDSLGFLINHLKCD